MGRVFGLSLMVSLSALGLPSLASAHDDGYRVCRDEDGHRVPCRVCRDEDGDRVPCRRVFYRYSSPGYSDYRYRAPYYGYYGSPRIIIGVGPRRFYGRRRLHGGKNFHCFLG